MTTRAGWVVLASALLLGATAPAAAKARGPAAAKARGPAAAKARAPTPPRPWRKGQVGRLDFDRARLGEVARVVAAITRRNIILADAARRVRVSIFSPAAVSRRQVWRLFGAVLSLHGLTLVGAGRIWMVLPMRDARGRR